MMQIHFCATACIVDKEEKKILFIHHKKGIIQITALFSVDETR